MAGIVKHKGLALATLATAQFMVILDATIVNVALPAIQKAFNFAASTQLQWVVTAYALMFGGFLLLGGRLADLFGRRRMLMIGLSVFVVASLMGGLAQNAAMLITFRAVQGLGGAMLAPAALSLVLTIFREGQERNRALGVWSMVAGGGGAVGLLLGGSLTQYISWRWVFFINVPIAVLVMLAASKFVPGSTPTKKQRLDYAGAVTITGSLMSLVFALAQAPSKGWSSSLVLSAFGLSALLMAAFIANELRRRQPLVYLGMFRRRNVSGGTIMQLLMPAAMFGMFFFLSIFFQRILGYSPTMTGVANVPFTLILILVAGKTSRNLTKINPKMVLTLAPLVVGLGLLWYSRAPLNANYWTDILPGIVLMALGMGMFFVTNTMVTTSGAAPEEAGLISGLLNTGQQIGGALGLAVLAVVSTAVTKADMAAANNNVAALHAALAHGFKRSFLVAALFTVIASLVAFTVLKPHKATKADVAQEAETEAESLAAVPGA